MDVAAAREKEAASAINVTSSVQRGSQDMTWKWLKKLEATKESLVYMDKTLLETPTLQ